MRLTVDLNHKARRTFAAMEGYEEEGPLIAASGLTVRLSYEQARALITGLWEMLPADYRPLPK